MTSRQSTFAQLAERFGHCVLENSTLQGKRLTPSKSANRRRLMKIARVMDRLARQPTSVTWHRRAERLHSEISAILRGRSLRVPGASLWAST